MDNKQFGKELEKRTKNFALRILRLATQLPQTPEGKVIRYQLVKAGTSVGANYREANRAISKADFRNKISICAKEASESLYWLEIIMGGKLLPKEKVIDLYNEFKQELLIGEYLDTIKIDDVDKIMELKTARYSFIKPATISLNLSIVDKQEIGRQNLAHSLAIPAANISSYNSFNFSICFSASFTSPRALPEKSSSEIELCLFSKCCRRINNLGFEEGLKYSPDTLWYL